MDHDPRSANADNILPSGYIHTTDGASDEPSTEIIPQQAVGVSAFLTARVLQSAHREALKNFSEGQLQYALVDHLLVAGKRVAADPKTYIDVEFNPPGETFTVIVDTIEDRRLASLLIRKTYALDKLVVAFNALSLWKIIWHRLRHPRSPLVEAISEIGER